MLESKELTKVFGSKTAGDHVNLKLEKAGLCETRRGMGTYVTADAGRIDALRKELARQAVDLFLGKMKNLGISRQEAAKMILKEE